METREQIESRLADLHRERGFALMHGKDFDNSLIDAEQEKLAALADLEAAKREFAAAEKAAADDAEILEAQAKLRALVAEQVEDAQQAQEAARIVAAAFARMLARMPDVGRTHRDITKASPPVCLNELELGRTLACRLSAVMRGALPTKYKQRLGAMLFHPGVCKADDNWAELDRATFEKHLALGGD